MIKIFAFDWATKKSLTIYDGKKIAIISNSIDAMQEFLADLGKEKAIMLFEFGGGEMFKVMAYRAGHAVMQVPGKRVKEYRDAQGKEKSDETDAKLLYDLFIEENGGERATAEVGNLTIALPSRPEKKEESGSAAAELGNPTLQMPSLFRFSNPQGETNEPTKMLS
jgi:hypothetical protein